MMDVHQLLPLHALGALDADEAAQVEAAVAADPELRVLLDTYREAAGALGGALGPVMPPPALRDRLFASIDAITGPGRYERFAARVAGLYDVTVEKARMFLNWIDDPARWESAEYPNVEVIHLPAGPAWAGADCGLVRMPAGLEFPWHDHTGEEVTLVLQGQVHDSSGVTMGPGDQQVLPPGAVHRYRVDAGGDDYIFAVRFFGIQLRDDPPPDR